jgi:hypothetical protein
VLSLAKPRPTFVRYSDPLYPTGASRPAVPDCRWSLKSPREFPTTRVSGTVDIHHCCNASVVSVAQVRTPQD